MRTIITALEKVINKYTCRSFNVTDYHGDNEFDKEQLKDFLQPALLHIYGRKEHVGTIERSVRTVKERFRSTCQGTPFKRMTILMVRSLVEGIVEILNAFPSENGVSSTMSPSTIVEGKPKLDLQKKMICFGSYAIVYTDTTNDSKARGEPGIALRKSNNAGGHYFMSLYSGRRIHGYSWDELPVDDYVIERVENLAEEQEQPIMHNGMPSFEWAPGVDISDIWDDEREEVLTISQEAPPILEAHPDVEREEPEVEEEDQFNNIDDEEMLEEDLENENVNDGLIIVPRDNIVSDDEELVDNDSGHDVDAETVHTLDDASNETAVAELDDEPMVVDTATNSRPRRANAGAGVERLQMEFGGKGYGAKREYNMATNGKEGGHEDNIIDTSDYMQIACNVMFTQMNAKIGLKSMGLLL